MSERAIGQRDLAVRGVLVRVVRSNPRPGQKPEVARTEHREKNIDLKK